MADLKLAFQYREEKALKIKVLIVKFSRYPVKNSRYGVKFSRYGVDNMRLPSRLTKVDLLLQKKQAHFLDPLFILRHILKIQKIPTPSVLCAHVFSPPVPIFRTFTSRTMFYTKN